MAGPGRVLVTGGTGLLGRQLVDRLVGVTEVRVLSRRSWPDTNFVQGDLETGHGLDAALEGVEVIAHCASAADYLRPRRDVTQVRRLLDAAAGGMPRVVYVSIVGADRAPFGFFRAKVEAERLIAGSGFDWTILRATEFHDFILAMVRRLAAFRVAFVPRGALFQPVDVGEVADRMVELVMSPASGRTVELGGPRVESMADLMRLYLAATGRDYPILQIPVRGKLGTALGVGDYLLTVGDRATVSFADFLQDQFPVSRDGAPCPER